MSNTNTTSETNITKTTSPDVVHAATSETGMGESATPIIPDVDRLIETLPEPVRHALADLDAAPDHVAQTAIGLMSFGYRALLEAVKVTRTTNVNALGESQVERVGEPRQRIELTDWGRRVIRGCAAFSEPEVDDDELERRAVHLRSKLAAAPATPEGT